MEWIRSLGIFGHAGGYTPIPGDDVETAAAEAPPPPDSILYAAVVHNGKEWGQPLLTTLVQKHCLDCDTTLEVPDGVVINMALKHGVIRYDIQNRQV